MKEARLVRMESYIHQREAVSIDELRDRFSMSLTTVRRDIAAMLKKGSVEKVYGGVKARKNDLLRPFDARLEERQESKQAIGRKAAEMARDGDIIFIDSGTTTMHVIPALSERRGVTIVTYSLHGMTLALRHPNLSVIALPGQLQMATGSITGLDALRFLRRHNIGTAFMAATGWSLTRGVTNSSPPEYEIKKAAMERSERRVLLIDAYKLGRTAMLSYAQIQDFHALVTDAAPGDAYADALREAGVSCEVTDIG
ncbi:MAG: DeoR/GlpR family DNA-binding transcription regulator [Oscillospiraceae bacterium]|jgi:DeoR family myo-inositol catabolism operon transcriptional repressor|nr:DeoR/GlpR family DNA-binding transcription regulator [Oscillospiraceae bacterium]